MIQARPPLALTALVTCAIALAPHHAPSMTRTFALGAHHEGTRVAMFSPDGERVVSAGYQHLIVRATRGGRQLLRIDAVPDREMLWGLDWSPDGKTIATVSREGTLAVWDASTGERFEERRFGALADYLTYAPDGRLLVQLANDQAALADRTFPSRDMYPVFSPDGARLVTSTRDRVHVWDARTGRDLAQLPVEHALFARWLPGERIAVVDWTRITIWDPSGRLLRTIESVERPWYVEVSPDGSTLFVSYYGASFVRAYDLASGDVRATFPVESDNPVIEVAGDRLVTCAGPDDRYAVKTIRVWNARTGALLELLGTPDAMSGFRTSHGLIALNTSDDARIVDLATHAQVAYIGGHTTGITAVAFAPGGGTFATASNRLLGDDFTAKLWDATTGELVGSVQLLAHVNTVDFAPDGSTFVTAANDSTVSVWDARTFELVRSTSHAREANVARYAPDGTTIASGGEDRQVRVWDATTGRQRLQLAMPSFVRDLRYAPSGAWFAAVDARGNVEAWDARTGRRIVETDACERYGPDSLEVTDDRILVSCVDHAVTFDLTGRIVARFIGGFARWSPDHARVLTRTETEVLVFDASGTQLATLPIVDVWYNHFIAEWTPAGEIIAGDQYGHLTRWSADGTLLADADARPGGVWALGFDPADASRFVVAGEDGFDQNALSALSVWQLR